MAPHQHSRKTLIAAGRRCGGPAGRDAADWWAQNTIGGRAPARTTAATARSILAGIDAGDPAVYDQLPSPTPGQVADAYSDTAALDAPFWSRLNDTDRETFDIAFTDAYTEAVLTRVGRLCHHLLADADTSNPADPS